MDVTTTVCFDTDHRAAHFMFRLESLRFDAEAPIGESAYKMLGRGKCNVARDSLRLISTKTGREKVVILGIGWGGYRLARDLDKVLMSYHNVTLYIS